MEVMPVEGQKQAFGLDLAKVRSTPKSGHFHIHDQRRCTSVELVTGRDAIKTLRERRQATMKYQIWYMKPSFLHGVVGSSPDPNNLSATHVHLKNIEADNQEDALSRMRAENWSPNGEALDLLQSKGPQHTTMTIADHAVYLVTGIGFSLLPKHGGAAESHEFG
jgi:hypothetical protein